MTGPPVRVDGSPCSAVYVCALCGCRDVATTRPIVLMAAAHHLDIAHPGQVAAAAILRARAGAATRRRAQKK